MIKAVYYRSENKLTVEGHAHSGEHGHDLICASASILAYTLADYVKKVKDEDKLKFDLIFLEEGDAIISCSPYYEDEPEITVAFDAICRGFELLARDYPDNISYEIRGKQ